MVENPIVADRPLLIFPEPGRAERTKRQGFGGRIRTPNVGQQAERLTPQFQRLQDAMEQKRAALQDNTFGIQPEQVLVLETVGSIENFINAVRRIPGLDWLGEFEHEPFTPEHGFADENNPEKELNGQLFLIMTDQQAQQQLRSLFNQWREVPNTTFPYGLAKLKDAFVHLHTVRPWDAEDRIRETGLLEDWEDRLESGQEFVPFEAELWFRNNAARRQQAESYLSSIIESLDGEVVQRCVIPEVAYHAVLGRMPQAYIQEIIAQPDVLENVRLFQCEGIRHIRPVGQCTVLLPEDVVATGLPGDEEPQDFPVGNPLVALFDGLPLVGHRKLEQRIILDDPDEYENAYQARERFHGTAMASIICHGDLDEGGAPVRRPLYARPIMKPRRGFDGRFVEAIPEDVLPIDLLHRAIRRLFEPENGESPVAQNVRVINLSVCDATRPFDREVSPMARLLDWLSSKYNILFIVSSGNHAHDLELEVPRQDLIGMTPTEREHAVIKAVAADTRHRRLLSPAETLNGLTLGATHQDASTVTSNHLLDPFTQMGGPSVINAQGPGHRRGIKPDILLPGGRQFMSEKLGTTHPNAILQIAPFLTAPGQRVATPGPQGEVDRTCHTRGTSNAAALASHNAMVLYDVIEELRRDPAVRLPTEYDAVLLKALLVHGSSWANVLGLYEGILKNGQNSRTFKEYVGHFLGYGSANIHKVLACTEQRATVLGVGKLSDGEGAEFNLPLPPSLAAVTEGRRLTITMSWLTPVSNTRQNYRVAHLWFDPKQRNILAPNRLYADFRAVQRGTVQHEVLEGHQAVPYLDGENITIKVNCRDDAGKITEQIRFALAVTLEVAEGVNIPVYQEIRDRLAIRIAP